MIKRPPIAEIMQEQYVSDCRWRYRPDGTMEIQTAFGTLRCVGESMFWKDDGRRTENAVRDLLDLEETDGV